MPVKVIGAAAMTTGVGVAVGGAAGRTVRAGDRRQLAVSVALVALLRYKSGVEERALRTRFAGYDHYARLAPAVRALAQQAIGRGRPDRPRPWLRTELGSCVHLGRRLPPGGDDQKCSRPAQIEHRVGHLAPAALDWKRAKAGKRR